MKLYDFVLAVSTNSLIIFSHTEMGRRNIVYIYIYIYVCP